MLLFERELGAIVCNRNGCHCLQQEWVLLFVIGMGAIDCNQNG